MSFWVNFYRTPLAQKGWTSSNPDLLDIACNAPLSEHAQNDIESELQNYFSSNKS